MKTVLITGCAGFIGSWLTQQFLAEGHSVVGIDNFITGRRENLWAIRDEIGFQSYNRFHFLERDLRKFDQDWKAPKLDAVYHLAALGSVPRSMLDPTTTHDHNVNGFINLLEWVRNLEEKPRVFFASSSSVYGDQSSMRKAEHSIGRPLSPYAATKQINEVYAKTYSKCFNIPMVGLRFFNVFGPRQNPDGDYAAVIPKWIKAMVQGGMVKMYGQGYKERDFTPVSEVVRIIMGLSDIPLCSYDVFNMGCGQTFSLKDLFERLKAITGYSKDPEFLPDRPGDIDCLYADTKQLDLFLGTVPKMSHGDFNVYLKAMVDEARKTL